MNFILFILIGALAGFLAGKIMKGRGFGVLGNIVIGILGAVIGLIQVMILGIEKRRGRGRKLKPQVQLRYRVQMLGEH